MNNTVISPVYPMLIQKYNTLIPDPNANVLDKINTIIDYLNQTGKLTNDVVDNWNKVMAWAMNDGLSTDVSNKLETMLSNGEFDTLFQKYIAPSLGDITLLQTVDKSSVVNAVNENVGKIASNTASLAQIAKQITDFYSPSDGSNWSNALQAALNYCKTQYQNGITVTLFVPKGDYQLVTPVSFDGYIDASTNTIFHLKMDGYFTASNGIGKMLTIKNCTGCDLDIKVKGLNHTTDHLIYSTDWSANVTGLDVALYLESCSYTKLNFYGKRFFGRGIEAKDCSANSWGTIRGDMVGQMLYIRGTSGFGSVGNIWVTEYMGSYFNVTDVTLPYYENMILNTSVKKAIVFDSCVSLWVDVMNVGNNSDDYEVKLLSCNNVKISSLYIYGKNTSPTDYCAGLYIFQSYCLDIKMNTSYIKGDALHIEGIKGSHIRLVDSFSENIGTVTTTSAYGVSQTTIDIYSRYRKGTGLIVQKGSGGQAVDSLNISINAKDRDVSNANATDLTVVDSDSNVKILPTTTANTINIPATNTITNASSTTSSFTNPPLNDSTVKLIITTPTTSLTGFALKSSWNNKVVRQNYVVSGSVALTCATNNGNVNSGDVICAFDKNQGPLLPVIFNAMLKLADGTIKMLDVDAEWSSTGTLIKAMSTVATSNIVNITLNFSYECQQ